MTMVMAIWCLRKTSDAVMTKLQEGGVDPTAAHHVLHESPARDVHDIHAMGDAVRSPRPSMKRSALSKTPFAGASRRCSDQDLELIRSKSIRSWARVEK